VDNDAPVLSRDGARLAFRRFARSAQDGLYLRAVDGSGEERRLAEITPTIAYWPLDWSPDGSRLLARRRSQGRTDVVSFAANDTAAEPRPLLATSFDESEAVFSPDGRFLAFVSNESGNDEVYVAPLRADGSVGPSVDVSAGSGFQPRWQPDGRAVLFYDGQEQLMTVPVTLSPRLVAGTPRVLLNLEKLGLTRGYNVLPDGRLLFVARGEDEGEISRLDVVLGFTSELAGTSDKP
jgi:Tol biopolymer transport system component